MSEAPVQYELPAEENSPQREGAESDGWSSNGEGTAARLAGVDGDLVDSEGEETASPALQSSGGGMAEFKPTVSINRNDEIVEHEPQEDSPQIHKLKVQEQQSGSKGTGRVSSLEQSTSPWTKGFASVRTLKMQSSTFSPEDEDEKLLNTFQLFDFDDTMSILADDLPFVLKSLGLILSYNDITAMQKAMDPAGKGEIDFETFKRVVKHSAQESMSSGEQWKAFRLFDTKQKGFISEEDMIKIATEDCTGILSEEQCRFVVDMLAKDSQKGISFEDWKLHLSASNLIKGAGRHWK